MIPEVWGIERDIQIRVGQTDLVGVPLEAALKILIHYGNTERPDKLDNIMLIARLDGHQNFSEEIGLPNANLRPLKAGPARSGCDMCVPARYPSRGIQKNKGR